MLCIDCPLARVDNKTIKEGNVIGVASQEDVHIGGTR